MNSNIIDFIHENSHLKADGHKAQVVKREETQSQKWVKICKVKYYYKVLLTKRNSREFGKKSLRIPVSLFYYLSKSIQDSR